MNRKKKSISANKVKNGINYIGLITSNYERFASLIIRAKTINSLMFATQN